MRPRGDATPSRRRRPRRRRWLPPLQRLPMWRVRMIAVLGVLGPGLVSGFADNDAGGITTYSLAGAKFGYDLLWVILVSQVVLFFTQEVGARLGLATGQGADGPHPRALRGALGRLRGGPDAHREPGLHGGRVRGHRRGAGPVRGAAPS